MKKLNDKIFDLMLEEASQQYVEQIAAGYPSAEELKGRYTFSPEFENWVEGVIQSEEKRLKRIGYKKVWKRIWRASQKISVALCMLFATFFLVAFTVPPIRSALLNFVTERHEDYVEVDLKDQDSEKDEMIANININMPEEFNIINVIDSKTMLIVTYENSAGETLQLERYLGTAGMIVDSEKSGFDSIMIREKEGYISSRNGKNTILFHDSEYGYTIMSEIDQDRLVTIAKGIID